MTVTPAGAPREHRIALATGLTYHCLEWGAGDGRAAGSAAEGQRGSLDAAMTYVLVHGFTDLAAAWQPVAERLAVRARVIAPDLRGHGDSEWIGAGGYYHFLDYVADLDDVVAQLVPGPMILVGHSMGGSVCSYWAGVRPGKLTALALVEGLGPPDQAAVDPLVRTASWITSWKAARAQPQKIMASVEAAAARLQKYDERLGADEALRLARAGTREVAGGVRWKHDPLHMTTGPYPYRLDVARAYWRRITCPVLFVDGKDSMMNLSGEERARRRGEFARGRHVELANCGHAVARHQPERLAELLLELL